MKLKRIIKRLNPLRESRLLRAKTQRRLNNNRRIERRVFDAVAERFSVGDKIMLGGIAPAVITSIYFHQGSYYFPAETQVDLLFESGRRSQISGYDLLKQEEIES